MTERKEVKVKRKSKTAKERKNGPKEGKKIKLEKSKGEIKK